MNERVKSQPQSLIDAFTNTPKDGLWYLMGSNISAETINIDAADKEPTTVVLWDEGEQDWRFMTLKDGAVSSSGMVGLNKTSEDEE